MRCNAVKGKTMAQYFMIGGFALLIGLFFKFVLTSEDPVKKIEYLWQKVLAKLRAYVRVLVPLLFFALFLVFNFDLFREVLGAALPETSVLTIRLILQMVFGTHSVMYSLQYLCAYAFLSSGICTAITFALQHSLYSVYFVREDELREEVSSNLTYSLKENTFSAPALVTLGQLRV